MLLSGGLVRLDGLRVGGGTWLSWLLELMASSVKTLSMWCPGVREGGEERVQAEEVIAVAVRDVDRGEVLPGRPDPLLHPPRVLGGKDGVNQHRVALAADQRDRGGWPGRLAPLLIGGISPVIGLYGTTKT
jgi:hypothetical protein